MKFYHYVSLLWLAVFPVESFAQEQWFFEGKRSFGEMIDALMSSPFLGVVGYSLITVVLFLIAMVSIFLLIMLLKK